MKPIVFVLVALPALAYALLVGCSDSAGVYYVHGWQCQPNSEQNCECEDSELRGTQVCLEDGSAWGECSGCSETLTPDGDTDGDLTETDGDDEAEGEQDEDGDIDGDEDGDTDDDDDDTDGDEDDTDGDEDGDTDGDEDSEQSER